MPINKKYLAELIPETYFHVYNRSNNQEILFPTSKMKSHFLQLIDTRLGYLMNVYTWCLIPNHFHYLIKTKSPERALDFLSQLTTRKLTRTEKRFLAGEVPFQDLALKAWTAVFQSYASTFNNFYKRKGNLFYTPFKREIIENEMHFRSAVVYIHTNPVKHGLVEDFRDFEWSSWKNYEAAKRTTIMKNETYEIFGGRQAFLAAHEIKESLLLRDGFWLP